MFYLSRFCQMLSKVIIASYTLTFSADSFYYSTVLLGIGIACHFLSKFYPIKYVCSGITCGFNIHFLMTYEIECLFLYQLSILIGVMKVLYKTLTIIF